MGIRALLLLVLGGNPFRSLLNLFLFLLLVLLLNALVAVLSFRETHVGGGLAWLLLLTCGAICRSGGGGGRGRLNLGDRLRRCRTGLEAPERGLRELGGHRDGGLGRSGSGHELLEGVLEDGLPLRAPHRRRLVQGLGLGLGREQALREDPPLVVVVEAARGGQLQLLLLLGDDLPAQNGGPCVAAKNALVGRQGRPGQTLLKLPNALDRLDLVEEGVPRRGGARGLHHAARDQVVDEVLQSEVLLADLEEFRVRDRRGVERGLGSVEVGHSKVLERRHHRLRRLRRLLVPLEKAGDALGPVRRGIVGQQPLHAFLVHFLCAGESSLARSALSFLFFSFVGGLVWRSASSRLNVPRRSSRWARLLTEPGRSFAALPQNFFEMGKRKRYEASE